MLVLGGTNRSEWVPNRCGSNPMLAIHSDSSRAYCRVVIRCFRSRQAVNINSPGFLLAFLMYRRQVEKQQRVRPWWRTDTAGNLVLSVYYGAKPIEFEKGKAGIAVASRDKLPALVDALLGAAKAGELDELMARMGKPFGASKAKRAA